MKKILLTTIIALLCSVTILAQAPAEIAPINAPFDMPQLQRPQFPDRSINIAKAGARQEKLSTKAIQKAIDKLAKKGGGTVIVPKGKWLTGRLTLKSNINLHIEEGAELHFSGEIKDYLPVVPTRNEGVDILSLGAMIYAYEAENIAITGKGSLVSPGYECEIFKRQEAGIKEEVQQIPFEQRIYDGSNGAKVFMPVFFGAVSCKNVLVEGLTFEHSIFWNINPVYCENVIIRDCIVNSRGHGRTDGIDIDSSVNTLIEYVTLDCGDDCFTLKAGRGNDGVDRNRPTENVVIRHCTVKRGVGGIAIGSETAAMIRNVYAHDCVMEYADSPFYFKTRRPRGGGAENIFYERIHIKNSRKNAISFDMLGSPTYVGKLANRFPALPIGKLTPMFRNITFKDITIDECPGLLRAKGLPERPIEGITFINLKAPIRPISLQDVSSIVFK